MTPYPPSEADDTDVSPPPPPSVHNCTTTEELQAALAHLNAQETAVTTRLDALLSTQTELTHSLGRLDLIRAHLGTQVVAARSLTNSMLSPVASTAARVTGAVKRLDIEQSRVKATLEVVEQVAELKACVLGVTGSMGAPQDWETAAGYLARSAKVPEHIVKGEFAEEMVPTAEVPDPPSVTLENAAEALCGLFLREFEKAAAAGDGEKVTRFFKLFPLIGRTEVGLEVYGRYVCQGVSARARETLANRRTSGDGVGLGDFFYGNSMSRLFEHIANIVEQHGKLVERHYGEGRMVKVIERLQVEADTQAGILIDTFGDERNVDRKLTDIKSYAFSFLVQSFLPQTRSAMGTPRSSSPAPGAPRMSEDEGVDVKEIDMLLSELGMMLSRWSLYCRFIARKCLPPQPDPSTDAEVAIPLTLPPLLQNSLLAQKVESRLLLPFSAMTTFFCRRSVEKAFQLDEAPSDLTLSLSSPVSTISNAPFITSAVDDVMYIVQTLLQRTLNTSQRGLVTTAISTIGRVLSGDFIGMIQRKMQTESYPKGATASSPPPDAKVISFLVLINNLDIATEYNTRIITSFATATSAPVPGTIGNVALEEIFPFQNDAAAVRDALRGMEGSFEAKAGELVADGITVFFNQVVKPRLRPLLTEAFRDVEYVVSDRAGAAEADPDGDAEPDDGEIVRRRFQEGWEALMTPYKRILTARMYSKLLGTTAGYFARLLEKRVWGYAGRINELGAIRLERDVAGVVGVVVRGGMYGVRDTFLRCTQICLCVNMEEDEVADMLEGTDGVDWKLEVDERRRARGMVVERR
ncbi:uncharacterized protein H6S33_011268 [Morchella sextelata]|uniref:uncharacterized protein n=1 Tax=Morchella sextelata TaxID=1174677 RepID=UPI001D039CD3|nr:uncharacterized protein H6S33_011268 [Morchella sextelata]KAH0610841.1 hypothetical protein H6S33_011268 [Morchella sextelata]